jgi:hypothetical protein
VIVAARTNSVEKENWAATTHRSTRPPDRAANSWPGGAIMIETRLNPLKTLGRLGTIRVALAA